MRAIQPRVCQVALRFCWQPADAEDATQGILLKVCTRLDSFRGEASLMTWVTQIAGNHLISMRRRAGEQRVQGFESYGDTLMSVSCEVGYRAEIPVIGPGLVLAWEQITVEATETVVLPGGRSFDTLRIATHDQPWKAWIATESPYIVKTL